VGAGAHSRIRQRVERQLGDEIQILVVAGIDLPGKSLLERTASVKAAELCAA
jgi:hypothetical protein